jgi:hypothetical protein
MRYGPAPSFADTAANGAWGCSQFVVTGDAAFTDVTNRLRVAPDNVAALPSTPVLNVTDRLAPEIVSVGSRRYRHTSSAVGGLPGSNGAVLGERVELSSASIAMIGLYSPEHPESISSWLRVWCTFLRLTERHGSVVSPIPVPPAHPSTRGTRRDGDRFPAERGPTHRLRRESRAFYAADADNE